MLTVRPLIEADNDIFWQVRLEALRLEPYAFGAPYDAYASRSAEGKLTFFQNNIAAPDNYIFGAFSDSKLVGITGLKRDSGPKFRHKAVVWGVYVSAEARGQGAGKALLQAAIEQARTIPGLLQLYLTVVVRQEAAQRLYRSCGFIPYGREPRSLKVGDEFLDEDMLWLPLSE